MHHSKGSLFISIESARRSLAIETLGRDMKAA
jgi:hypothetical protein